MQAASPTVLSKCPRCFKVASGAATFCPRCGMRLILPKAPSFSPPQQPQYMAPPRPFSQPVRRSSARPVLAVVGLFILIGAIVPAFFNGAPVRTYNPPVPTPVYPRHDDSFTPYRVPEAHDTRYPERPSPYPYDSEHQRH